MRSIKTISLISSVALLALSCSDAPREDEPNETTANHTNHTSPNHTAGNHTSPGNNTSPTNNTSPANNNTSPTNNVNNRAPVTYDGLVINEVVAAGAPDWVELKNTSSEAIALDGCSLSDDPMNVGAYLFEGGEVIEAGGYLSVDISDETTGFKLGGDELVGLYAPDGEVIDLVDWEEGDAPDGASFARLPDGTGDFETTGEVTRDAQNASGEPPPVIECGDGVRGGDEACDGEDLNGATCQTLGFERGELACDMCAFDTSACIVPASGGVVINEVTSSGDDQIELTNTSEQSVDISKWLIADDKYPADDTEVYLFAEGTMIAPGEYLVLVKDVDHTFGVGGMDTITLYDGSGAVIDQAAIMPDGGADPSFCRLPDGTGDFTACLDATFGMKNTENQ